MPGEEEVWATLRGDQLAAAHRRLVHAARILSRRIRSTWGERRKQAKRLRAEYGERLRGIGAVIRARLGGSRSSGSGSAWDIGRIFDS